MLLSEIEEIQEQLTCYQKVKKIISETEEGVSFQDALFIFKNVASGELLSSWKMLEARVAADTDYRCSLEGTVPLSPL